MTPTTETEYESAFQHGVASLANLRLQELNTAIIPEGYRLEDLEDCLPAPTRIRESVKLTRSESFEEYVNDFKRDGTLIFADIAKRTFEAVLDYHTSNEEPTWGTHKATLSLPFSSQFEAWRGKHRQWQTQVDFAEWLEDRELDVIDPNGATLLTLASNLEATKTARFKSSTRLDNGASSLVYEESIDGRGNGQIRIPSEFTLRIPVFEGGEFVSIRARLRYRIDAGLKFTYIMEEPTEIVRNQFLLVADSIKENTECSLVYGSRS